MLRIYFQMTAETDLLEAAATIVFTVELKYSLNDSPGKR
jgi:hypothetical protein